MSPVVINPEVDLGWRFDFNGIQIGADTDVEVTDVDGLDLPDYRTSDSARSNDHGAFVGEDLLDARTVEIGVELWATSDYDREYWINQLKGAMAPSSVLVPLSFQLGEVDPWRVYCRPRRAKFPIDYQYTRGAVQGRLQFFAPDPRIYDDVESVFATGLPVAGGGLTFPVTFPISFGVATSGGVFTATNAGNFFTRPYAVITGPVVNPSIENQTTGKTLSFNITLLAGETLMIDFDAHSVLLNSTASRRSAVIPGSKWWDLPPGDSIVRFQSNSYSAGTLDFSYRSAWL